MLGVENIRSCTATTTTFQASAATPITTTAAPAVVAGAGVGLIPLVAATTGEPDPRSLLVPVPTLGGSNPTTNNAGTTTSNNNSNSSSNSSSNNIGSNPSTMEQVEEFVKPIIKDGEMILEVECGQNKAAMYLSKLCQGSKGPCINFQGSWLTPNEFQFVSGRETAKDWKRSIRHHGKSLKLLLAKGILTVHPTMCDCEGCRIGAVLTRKGEKRRIPNGERKRKSTGNAPENSGNGAFRAVGNGSAAVKNQDGPSDPKRVALDRSQEGGQSPLKESSMMNLPESKGSSGLRLPEGHMAEVSKIAVDSRVGHTPLMPLVSPDRGSDTSNTATAAAISPSSIPKDQKDSTTLPKPSSEKRRHSSNNSSSGGGQHSSIGAVADPVISSSDVKVLSSSGGAGTPKVDKSMSRLALYQAVSASVKGEVACNVKTDGLGVSATKCDSQVSMDEKPTSDNAVRDGKAVEAQSPEKEARDFSTSADVMGKPVSPKADTLEPKDLKTDDKSLKSVDTHSTESHHATVCEPSNNNNNSINNNYCSTTLSASTPLSPTGAATSSPAAPTVAAPHTKPSPTVSNSHKEDRHKHTSSSLASPPSVPSKASPDKGEHLTIRHPSPERPPANDAASMTKQSPVKSTATKEHSSEKVKDRKHESTPSSSSSFSSSDGSKDRHVSRDKDSASRHHHEREAERRRSEEKADRDRKSGVSSGQSSRAEEPSYRGPEFQGVGVARAEGLPVTAQASVPIPVADPAAFSEYMRALAAGHHGLVPPPMPPMYLRPPTDVPVSSGLLHPMHAAACGMFSTPSAMLPKDPVLYATTAGTLPTASYGYGAPGMAPLPLLPHQYTAAASTPMLDYSRPFSYLPWSGGLSLMMPDAMSAAAAAAAAAAASSSAKRNREEMESAADLAGKRLSLPMAAYGAGSIAPIDYMAAYRGLATPLSCGMESSMYDKNAEFMRKRMYPELAASAAGGAKGMESPYLASLPDYYRALYCCRCMENRPGDIRTWGVEDVVKLVSSLEGCSVYTEIFREQRVDGKILVLLTTDHLMKNLGMKLGPAMTLTSRVAKILLDSTRASGCDTCRRLASMVPAVQSAVGY